MKKKELIFILINSIAISFLWWISCLGTNDITLIAFILAIILEFGGEFIISCIYSYNVNYEINLKLYIFSAIINIIMMKVMIPRIYNFYILLFCINQILGISFGIVLKEMVNKNN